MADSNGTLGCIDSNFEPIDAGCVAKGESFTLCFKWNLYDPTYSPENDMQYIYVPITYAGSLASHIQGPSEIKIHIPTGNGCINIRVNTELPPEGGTLVIIPADTHDQCGDENNSGFNSGFNVEICYKDEEVPPEVLAGGTDSPGGGIESVGKGYCCTFFDDTYETWTEISKCQDFFAGHPAKY